MPDQVVDRIPQSESIRGAAGKGMCVLWSSPDRKTAKRKFLQPVLLFVGDTKQYGSMLKKQAR